MHHRAFSRVLRAGLSASLALTLIACGNGSERNGGGPVGTGFNMAIGFNDSVLSIASAGDGSGDVYVGGNFSSYQTLTVTRLVRLNSDGTVDTDFVTGSGFNGPVRSIALADDGSGDIYVGGDFTNYKSTPVAHLVRLHADGSIDPVFATGIGFNDTVRSIAPTGDGTGDIYVGGDFTSYNTTTAVCLVRIRTNGTVNPLLVSGTGFSGAGLGTSVRSVVPANDGTKDVYVGGAFTTYNGITARDLVRLNENGTVDLAFATGAGFDNTVYSIALTGDGTGDLYVSGAFTSYNGVPVNNLLRLHANGIVEPTFAIGTGFNNIIYSIALSGDGTGDLYVGGAFTSYNGVPVNELLRLRANGIINPTFSTGTSFDNVVLSVVPASDGTGDLYVGGEFTSYQNVTIGRIVRLTSAGSIAS